MVGAGSFLKRSLLIIMALGIIGMGCSGGGAALKKDRPDVLAKLQKIDVKDGDEFTTVVAAFDKPVIHNSVRLSDPPKLLIDLAGVDVGEFDSRIEVNKGLVSYITPSRVLTTKRLARLEIGLNSDSNYKIVQAGNIISIVFEKKKEAVKAEAKPADVKVAEVAAAPAKAETDKAPAPDKDKVVGAAQEAGIAAALSQPKPAITVDKAEDKPSMPAKAPVDTVNKNLPEATRVEKITCDRGDGSYRVNIAGNGKFSNPKVFMLGKDRLVVDLPGTGSVKEQESINVGGTCLKRVRMARHQGGEKKVRVVLDIEGAVDYDVKGNGKSLVLTVALAGSKAASKPAVKQDKVMAAKAEPSKAAGVPTVLKTSAAPAAAPAARVVKVEASENAKPAGPASTSNPVEAIKISVSREGGRTVLSSAPAGVPASNADVKAGEYVETPTKIYTGGKISFDVQDADLDKVMKLLADVAGLNLIIDPNDVKGKVTLKLDNVPWDQALDILLKIYNLDKVLEGNILRVAPKSKLDDEKKRELMLITEQKKLQEDAEDLYTKSFQLDNATAKDMEPMVKKMLSKRGDATSNTRTNELIVTDIKANVDKVGKVIKILDKGVSQIMIEARIVNVSVDYSQSLGISWGLQDIGKNHNHKIASGPNSDLLFKDTLKDANGNDIQYNDYVLGVPDTLKKDVAGVAGNFLWGGLAKDVNIDLTISALETIGKAETLSAPKVMTLENQSAEIVSGFTIYVQSTSASGSAPMPLNANLSLTVTPRVTSDGFIVLDVIATNNDLDRSPPAGAQASINTKSIKTKVMVKDGNTVVLGGIYTKSNTTEEDQVPLLGRIPLLGWLFKTRTISHPTSELLIFITPKMIKQPGQLEKV